MAIDLIEHLVAHYKMNDNAASAAVVDSQGFSNGTAQQNTDVLHTAGKIDGALTFNGTSDYVNTNATFQSLFRSDFAIAFRCRPDDTDPETDQRIFAVPYNLLDPKGRLLITLKSNYTGTLQVVYYTDSETYVEDVAEDLFYGTDGEWVFVIVIVRQVDGEVYVDIYRDGELLGQQSGEMLMADYESPNNLVIGRDDLPGDNNDYWFKGAIDNVMLFDKALSEEEIAYLCADIEDLAVTVTASAGENGSISPSGESVIAYGADLSFTATPATGYAVNQWLVDDEVVHVGGSSHTLTNVTADRTITVTFSAISRHLCTLADVKTRLGLGASTDFDDVIQQIIDGIDGLFDSYTGRVLLTTDADVTEYYTSDLRLRRLLLRRYPVISITSIREASDYDFDAATALVVNTDYRLVNQGLNGVIYRVYDYWLADEDSIQFVYRAGYCGAGESPAAGEFALPDDLHEAAIEQATFLFKRKDDIGLSSVSVQGGSISKFADVELLPLVKQILDRYKRPSL